MLPELEIDEEDEESIEDLKFRLLEYKKFKDAAQKIKSLYKNKDRLFERSYVTNIVPDFYPGNYLDKDNILLSAKGLVNVLDKFESLRRETILETVSIKEKISNIQKMLSNQVNVRFNSIIENSKSKVDAIVSFLALLELIKQKIVSVKQDGNFEDIEIKLQNKITN